MAVTIANVFADILGDDIVPRSLVVDVSNNKALSERIIVIMMRGHFRGLRIAKNDCVIFSSVSIRGKLPAKISKYLLTRS